jgi:hypothetical protein
MPRQGPGVDRRAWVGLIAGLLVVTGCGTESALGGEPRRTPIPTAARRASPTATPSPPPPTCPASGALLSVGHVDAALGHRAVVIKLTNCHAKPLTLDGYPAVTVLDEHRKSMKVIVTRGTSYMAVDPGPTKLHLKPGASAQSAVSWSNTVEAGLPAAAGTYLSLAKDKQDTRTVWPVVTDIGTTGKITLTAWCLQFPR